MDDEEHWARGVVLAEAWREFAPPRLRREYKSYRPGDKYGPIPDLKEMTAAQLKAAVPDLPGQILDGLGWTEPDVAPEMRDWLLERLCAGNFAAYGRPSKPVPGDRAVRIPSKLFEFGKVDWRRSKLKGDGFAYGSITVCRPPGASAVPAIVNETSEAAETDADKRRRLVREAYARMIPKLPDRHTKTGICAEIAKQMKVSHGSLFPGEFGLDRSTICRHLKGMSGF